MHGSSGDMASYSFTSKTLKNMTLQLNENEALLSVLLDPVRKYPYFLENMFRYVRLKSHYV